MGQKQLVLVELGGGETAGALEMTPRSLALTVPSLRMA